MTMRISRPCDEWCGRQTNKSVISLTSSRVNVNCTEIGRARHIVKRRLTALSFTTGLVIRISHDEALRSPQPLTLLQPVCFIWLQKKKNEGGGDEEGWDQPNG